MENLAENIQEITEYRATYGGQCRMEEKRRFGLTTVLFICCTPCYKIFKIELCERLVNYGGKRWAVNVGAVWASL